MHANAASHESDVGVTVRVSGVPCRSRRIRSLRPASSPPAARSSLEGLSARLSVSPPLHCRFYDEIRTPLLSDIRIGYPPGLVQQATRTFFPNYFNGSEIVIAGKLVDRQLDRLRVEVTASNSKKFVVLKTDVPVEPQRAGGPGPEDNGTAGPNPLERLWSYLTVRELLSSWLQSGDGREKERLRQQAQALAVNSRFLTPFTRMRLKKAPGTRQPQRADAVGVSAATGPGTAVQSPPPGTSAAPARAGAGGPGRPFRLLSRPRSPHSGLLGFVVIFTSGEAARTFRGSEGAALLGGSVARCGSLQGT